MSLDYNAEINRIAVYLLCCALGFLVAVLTWMAKKVKSNQEILFDITRKQGVKIATQGTQIEDIKEICRERHSVR